MQLEKTSGRLVGKSLSSEATCCGNYDNAIGIGIGSACTTVSARDMGSTGFRVGRARFAHRPASRVPSTPAAPVTDSMIE